MIVRVLVNMGATVQACGTMYKVVAQSVLFYGSESCLVTGWMLKVLEGFHYRVDRRITGMMATRGEVKEW